jgi:hypothetical protein
LPLLDSLVLSGTKVEDASLAHLARLKGLKSLLLEDTPITDAGLVHLAGLPGLKSLNLANTRVTDEGVARLQKAMPRLRINREAPPSARASN